MSPFSSPYLLCLDLPRRVRRHPHQDQQARPDKAPERSQTCQPLDQRGRGGEGPQKRGPEDRHPVERARNVLGGRPPGPDRRDAGPLLLELLGEVGRVELEEGVVVVEEDDEGDGGLKFGFFFEKKVREKKVVCGRWVLFKTRKRPREPERIAASRSPPPTETVLGLE